MKQLLLLLLLLIPAPVLAQDSAAVTQARRSGLVGERYDGYLGIIGRSSPELRRQVGAINIRRRALYSNLAARKGATPEEVGLTAACSLLRRIAVGEYYFSSQGWRRRAPGQSPAPSYCG